ncbi:MAG: C39 family peptidase [Acutalibacteraceae bacterium]
MEITNNANETSKIDMPLEENMEERLAEQESVIAESEHQINSFDVIFQMPELPTGCEITALTMVLNYYGIGSE